MKIALAGLLMIWSTAALARGLADAPPKGVDLNGTWQLNTTLSDDAYKIVEHERARHAPPQQMRRYRRRDGLDELLQVPSRMTIEHVGARFAFITPKPAGGERRAEFRAGTNSVVSVVNGVADRSVGWSRKAFVISTRAVEGLRKDERYEIDSEGRLRFITEVRGEDIRKLVITRVYDRVIA